MRASRLLVVVAGSLLLGCLDFDALLDDCRAGRTCDAGLTPDAATSADAGDPDAGPRGSDGGADCAPGGRATLPTGDGAVAFCFNGFTWESPLPHGADLKTVWGRAPDDVWAAGDATMVMHWDGRQWTSYQGVVTSPALWRRGFITKIAAGDAGVFLAGEVPPHQLLGDRWTSLTTLDGWDIVDAVVSPDGPVLMRGDGELVVSPPDFSTVLMERPSALANSSAGMVLSDGQWCAVSGLTASDRQRVWTCDAGLRWVVDAGSNTGRGGVLWADARGLQLATERGLWSLADDGGVTLTASTAVTYRAVTPTGTNRLLAGASCAVAEAQGTRHTVNGCNSRYTLSGITTFEDGGGWAVGEAGALVRQSRATEWSFFTRGIPNDLFALSVDDVAVAWAGSNGRVFERGDPTQRGAGNGIMRDLARVGPAKWLAVSEDTNLYEITTGSTTLYTGTSGQDLRGLSAGPDESWAVGVNVFVGNTDGGWRAEQPPFAVGWWKIARSGAFIVAAGEQSSVAWRTVGGLWRGVAGPGSMRWYGIWSDAPMKGWIAGAGASLFRFELSADGGTFQRAQISNAAADLYDVWGFAADDVWAVGNEGLVFHYDGLAWTYVEIGTRAQLERVRGRRLPDGTRELFIVGAAGSVLRTRY